MVELTFEFQDGSGTRRGSERIVDLVIAGWTGRDPHKVQEHIDELAALGIAPPASTPCFYRAGVEMPTTATRIDCLGDESSGEAEYVLLVAADGSWWVGLGSDHTDRKVESYSIPVSKQMCPKPVAPVLWRFDEVAPHWDSLEIRSWVEEGGERVLYQQGSVAAMLDPRETVAAYARLGSRSGQALAPGSLMFGGTLPVIGGLRPRRVFAMELHDPVLGRRITHRYEARWLPG
ncbi:DUF2848 domain-containing protein [Roseomonas sp. NAR14]|uniref:DUF2848 domain-containing protein n=1 Tax=Roseomonas acroporae TaxID=2937791 RepID=A0A9X1Y971_9PROT|nr:DUF2848 domain-containing protein [Roseomonas acroporae]MCK8784427.1 DUF2848 domain-containing protein [Roseomonas acroporae]